MKKQKKIRSCSNCKYQLKLFKHPGNTGIGKGKITEQLGYACRTPYDDFSNKGNAIFFENKYGMCEFWHKKEQKGLK